MPSLLDRMRRRHTHPEPRPMTTHDTTTAAIADEAGADREEAQAIDTLAQLRRDRAGLAAWLREQHAEYETALASLERRATEAQARIAAARRRMMAANEARLALGEDLDLDRFQLRAMTRAGGDTSMQAHLTDDEAPIMWVGLETLRAQEHRRRHLFDSLDSKRRQEFNDRMGRSPKAGRMPIFAEEFDLTTWPMVLQQLDAEHQG